MSTTYSKNTVRLTGLRRSFWGIASGWLIIWLMSWGWLRLEWPFSANRWALISGLVIIYALRIIWRGLEENHREGEALLLPTLGWGNQLSLFRGLTIAGVAGFLFSPWPLGALGWIPVLLYTIADVADYFDGYIARKTNHATRLGSRLDMEFDGLGMFVVTVLGVWYGQLPWWYLLLGTARYFFIAGLWIREQLKLPVYPLHPSVHRRVFAGFQMGFMSAVLWPIIPFEATTIAGTLFAIPTAIGFLRDWFVVSGKLDVKHKRYVQIQQFLVKATRVWLPPILRLLFAITLGIVFGTLEDWLIPLPWQQLLILWGAPFSFWLTLLLGLSAWLSFFALASGTMGRIFSLVAVFPIGFDIASQGISAANGVALGCVVCLMLLGTGPFSLWVPEERFVLEQLGD